MLCGRVDWFVPQYQRSSGSSNSVDLDRARVDRVLEDRPHQSMGTECRCSLAGVISSDTIVCRPLLSDALPSRRIVLRIRISRGLGRHHRGRPGIASGRRDAHSISEDPSGCLEHDRTDRHRFCCLQRAAIRIKRLAVDACVAGTSAQSFTYVPGAANYRISRFDFLPSCTSEGYKLKNSRC